ncbi:uncharacterized protein LOC141717330 [Apium graveolens]|uniref:uncharacterized protein LOC141717330 n=1 Tax=Apium graveolens TaxID=4045 RepID=UPI003D7A821F
MSNLKKRIQRGDFSDNSSDEEGYSILQALVVTNYQNMQTSQNQGGHTGSVRGRSYIRRDRIAANERIHSDYFSMQLLFNDQIFLQHFRMPRPLFERILCQLQQHDNYFKAKFDAVGAVGLSGIQKMTASLRMLTYGTPTDSVDEYVKIRKSTSIESLKKFCRGVVDIFESEYLRSPNETDITRLLRVAEDRVFPGMLDSLDCIQ